MDLATGVGRAGGVGVPFTPIMIDGGTFAASFGEHAVIARTERGLDVSIADQDGRAMFPDGSTRPNDRTLRLLERLAPALRRMPNRIAVTGFTSSDRPGAHPAAPPWELSAGRAISVREIPAGAGVPNERFSTVAGKGDTEPMFSDAPSMPANRRVTVTLLKDAPPVPMVRGCRGMETYPRGRIVQRAKLYSFIPGANIPVRNGKRALRTTSDAERH